MTSILITIVSALQMLASFTNCIVGDYQYISPEYACFRGENTMGSDERGVRTNADLSMVSAFMCRYAADSVALPAGITYNQLDTMAMKTLAYAVATHKAVRKRTCRDGRYWGSTGRNDKQWESSLWALSVAYSALFQRDKLSPTMKADIHRLLRAECNYELERDIPTGYRYDTKAEENGWEVGVLAAAVALFPDDSLATRWYARMRDFVVNSYSHPSDATDTTAVTPWIDKATVADLYRGPNLFSDWTLQNHGFFHTSYQNVVIQELGEAALIIPLAEMERRRLSSAVKGRKRRHTLAPAFVHADTRWMLHNCGAVERNVLNWLTLADGEQAMPNGNDWSLFLYDQVTSYSTMACMLGDDDALLFERLALSQIARRQRTTADGSWLLHPDVGARRMGVEGHRVMMTWLMHHVFPTTGRRPTAWADFLSRYRAARYFPCQRIVRTLTPDYFACFSFADGKHSYTGYIAPTDSTNNNLVVPYRKFDTGNIIGYYTVEGRHTNARLVGEPIVSVDGPYFTIRATTAENDSALIRHFTITTTADGLEYSDTVEVIDPEAKITADRTGLLAISDDPFTATDRHYVLRPGTTVIDGLISIIADSPSPAVVTDRSTDNSITTLKVYPFLTAPQLHHHIIYRVAAKH
ncbi:hypothetical protein [uncultured Prevotella sp.]|uniref:hypothetical protein n=1 Tax=uncultured Prevotella sp. TaxID=159272 RepID=UPI002594BB70|nr:hypothetical protein [uncultured Prevotella sp.]